MPDCDRARMAERSYPSLRLGVAAGRSYPTPEARGGSQEELPHVRGRGSGRECQAATAQEQPREATQRERSGAAAERGNPTSKEQWLCGRRRA